MEIREYFVQRPIRLAELGEGRGYVSSDCLLNLIKDDEVKQYVIDKYILGDGVDIMLPKIDLFTAIVKDYTNRFDTQRVKVSEDNVTTSFVENQHNDVDFILKNGTLDGMEIDELTAISLYDSLRMFYDDRRLSQYITYLRKELRDKDLLKAVNQSWEQRFEKEKARPSNKMFRLIYDKVEEQHYVKAINSDKFREFGIGETFVVAFLELAKLSNQKGNTFFVSSLSLSESKIEIILRSSVQKKIPELGYVYPSITIRNDDQGNASFGLYSSLEFKLGNVDSDGNLHLFPNRNAGGIENSKTYQHTVTAKTFVDSYAQIEDFFADIENFESDFYFLSEAVDPDHLRAKIGERILSARSPFKDIKELKDLFSRDSVGHVENLSTLLKLCGRAEMIDMNFDLKFQLRYIISNVLLYGNNGIE
ncbi:hypothetical protein MUB18_15640 [Sphingobacterium sp. PCS056]|uniref:hypothetical protein n=1 Tax=Sphingobacterium sp. PCS056 TaxID=2931400 RepID=UPI00200FD8E2|nr:hypothetical protein [Sphingobacterium sp. PCS056]UPZ35535.1 hypothetical protein MUB18_15640 [Sphingobacterium sp. PCS056]